MNKTEFINELKELGLNLDNGSLNKLNEFYHILIEENKKYNLTRIVEENDVYLKHFYDSLTIIKIIDINSQKICDLGSGAGFPGLVLAICFSMINITLIEANEKRCHFLYLIKERLNLNNVSIINIRIEDYARNNREKFDIVTARAVAPLKHLLEYGVPLVKIDGCFIAMKARTEKEEIGISNYLTKLSIKEDKREVFYLPYENSFRTLIKYIKTSPTNLMYPRKYSEILKKDI